MNDDQLQVGRLSIRTGMEGSLVFRSTVDDDCRSRPGAYEVLCCDTQCRQCRYLKGDLEVSAVPEFHVANKNTVNNVSLTIQVHGYNLSTSTNVFISASSAKACNDHTTTGPSAQLLGQHKRDGTIPSDSRRSESSDEPKVLDFLYEFRTEQSEMAHVACDHLELWLYYILALCLPTNPPDHSQLRMRRCYNSNTSVRF